MGDTGGPYLFDVGVIALAHTDAPVRDAALSYSETPSTGDIDAVAPVPGVARRTHGADDALRPLEHGCLPTATELHVREAGPLVRRGDRSDRLRGPFVGK